MIALDLPLLKYNVTLLKIYIVEKGHVYTILLEKNCYQISCEITRMRQEYTTYPEHWARISSIQDDTEEHQGPKQKSFQISHNWPNIQNM